MKKPEVDYIKGICPAIAIEQKVSTSNARSTVGSMTEIYDYLRLLYARIGKTFSPISGDFVKKHEVSDVVNYIFSLPAETKIQLLIPFQKRHDRSVGQELDLLMQKGYSRVLYENVITEIASLLENTALDKTESVLSTKGDIKILIDRFVVNDDDDNKKE